MVVSSDKQRMFIAKSLIFHNNIVDELQENIYRLLISKIIRIMTTLIFGVGVGLFLILSLWLLAGVLFLISLRVEKKFGTFVILIVGIFTVVLVSIPRGSNKSNVSENKFYDHQFVWRLLLLVFLSISSIVGFGGYLKFGLLQSIKPVRISSQIW